MATLLSSFVHRGAQTRRIATGALLCGIAGLLVGSATPQTADAQASVSHLSSASAACEAAGTYDVGAIPTRYQPLTHTAPATIHQVTSIATGSTWYGRIVISTYAGCTNGPTAGTFVIQKTKRTLSMAHNVSAVTAISSSFVAATSPTGSSAAQVAIQPHTAVLQYTMSAGHGTVTTKTTTLPRQNALLTVNTEAGTVALVFTLPAVTGTSPLTVALQGVREMHGVTQGPGR